MSVAVRAAAAAGTHIGRVRRQNQDAYGIDEEQKLYVVCDGMGGAAGGEIASHIAVDTFLAEFRSRISISASVESARNALYYASLAANRAVLKRALEEPSLRGMGCTLVGAHIFGERLLLVNIGDSRAYMVRNREIAQLTQDHSYLDEQVRLGHMTRAMADASNWQSVITRAVGIDADVKPDLFGVDLAHGDIVLLNSDGLTRHLSDREISAIAADGESAQTRVDRLLARACDKGGTDNVTCVLIDISL